MSKKFETAATCERRCMIRLLVAKNYKTIESHRQIGDVYGEEAMSDSVLQRGV